MASAGGLSYSEAFTGRRIPQAALSCGRDDFRRNSSIRGCCYYRCARSFDSAGSLASAQERCNRRCRFDNCLHKRTILLTHRAQRYLTPDLRASIPLPPADFSWQTFSHVDAQSKTKITVLGDRKIPIRSIYMRGAAQGRAGAARMHGRNHYRRSSSSKNSICVGPSSRSLIRAPISFMCSVLRWLSKAAWSE